MMEGDEGTLTSGISNAQTEIWRQAIERAGGTLVDMREIPCWPNRLGLAAGAAAIDIRSGWRDSKRHAGWRRGAMMRIGGHLGEVIADRRERPHLRDGQ